MGQHEDAVEACRAGLAIHPGYLSARVTLGRALIELNQLSEAQTELEIVLKGAPENLAAIRGLAEIHHRRGNLGEALTQYRAALSLARNDPDLEQTVSDLTQKLEPAKTSHSAGGLSFEQAQRELSAHVPVPELGRPASPSAPTPVRPPAPVGASVAARPPPAPPGESADDPARARAARVVAALEQWLGAIHVARAQRHA